MEADLKYINSFPETKTKLLSSGMRLHRGAASRLVKKNHIVVHYNDVMNHIGFRRCR